MIIIEKSTNKQTATSVAYDDALSRRDNSMRTALAEDTDWGVPVSIWVPNALKYGKKCKVKDACWWKNPTENHSMRGKIRQNSDRKA